MLLMGMHAAEAGAGSIEQPPPPAQGAPPLRSLPQIPPPSAGHRMQSPRHPHDRVRFGNVGADACAVPADAELPEVVAPSKVAAADAAAAAIAGKDEHTQMQELLGGYLVGGMTCNLVFIGET